jgi:hypothetical protein
MAEPDWSRQVSAPHQHSSWVASYDRLLGKSGLDRHAILTGALATDHHRRRPALSLAQCLDQPTLLIEQVRRDYPHAADPRTLRAQIAVLQQDLALNVIAPLSLTLFRDGEAPFSDPERIFLAAVDQAETSTARWFMAPGSDTVDEQGFIRTLAQQTKDWYPVFRHKLGVSPGAYWSSIGLGLGAPFSAVWNLAEPAALCNLAQQWLGEFDNEARQFIDWIPAVFDGQTTAIPQRKGCCLKYLLPDGGYCGTCGIYRKERMAALQSGSAT